MSKIFIYFFFFDCIEIYQMINFLYCVCYISNNNSYAKQKLNFILSLAYTTYKSQVLSTDSIRLKMVLPCVWIDNLRSMYIISTCRHFQNPAVKRLWKSESLHLLKTKNTLSFFVWFFIIKTTVRFISFCKFFYYTVNIQI